MSKNMQIMTLVLMSCAYFFLSACQQPSELERAEQAIIDRKNKQAIAILTPLAENNDAQAQALLAFVYYPQDNQSEQLTQWAEKAALAQHPLGYFILANAKIRSINDGELDDNASERENIRHLLTASADLGFTPAMLQLSFERFKETKMLSYSSIRALMSVGGQSACIAKDAQLIDELYAIKPALANISIFEEAILQRSLEAYLATIGIWCMAEHSDILLALAELQISTPTHTVWLSSFTMVDEDNKINYQDSYDAATRVLTDIIKNTKNQSSHYETHDRATEILSQLTEGTYDPTK